MKREMDSATAAMMITCVICSVWTMCGGIFSNCKDTQKFFNSPSWEWKVQGCNELGENPTLEFKYLHVPSSVLWDGRNGNL